MKKMFALVLALCLVLCASSAMAEITVKKADGNAAVLGTDYTHNVDKLVIMTDDLIVTSGTVGTITINANVKKLTLKNVTVEAYEGMDALDIKSGTNNIELIFEGTNVIKGGNGAKGIESEEYGTDGGDGGRGIYSARTGVTTITVVPGSTLTVMGGDGGSGGMHGMYSAGYDGGDGGAGIKAEGDLVISGVNAAGGRGGAGRSGQGAGKGGDGGAGIDVGSDLVISGVSATGGCGGKGGFDGDTGGDGGKGGDGLKKTTHASLTLQGDFSAKGGSEGSDGNDSKDGEDGAAIGGLSEEEQKKLDEMNTAENDGEFKYVAPPVQPDDNSGNAGSGSAAPNGEIVDLPQTGRLPETGDPTSLMGWVCLLGAAGAGLKLRKKQS